MFIKQVIIQGFRSYRDQTVIEPFSPRHNVVVGRNGSGKSNFFYAIQFVLSDEFTNLRAEERQALLHEGSGARIISAYVDIIFDNTDNRLPIEKEEVVLRRIIGAKKDQYFLDNKLVTRTDVMNLLESAGFSRCNPYYIVKQGKINMMATAPDSQRLKLLKEVAGTKVYDERKVESKKILEETQGKKAKIEDLLKYIEERLSTLESEKEELKQFQKLDKKRRSLEYTIHNNELKEATKKMADLNKRREQSGDHTANLRRQQREAAEKVQLISKELRELKSKIQVSQEEKEQLNFELQELVKEKAKLELEKSDMRREVDDDASTKRRANKELTILREKIAEAEQSLAEIRPKYSEQFEREEKAKNDLAKAEQRRKELYAKQSRGNQFQTREQRDGWIRKELKGLDKALKQKQEQIQRLEESLADGENKDRELERKTTEINQEMEKQKATIDQNNQVYMEKKREKDNLANERNALWRQENTLQQALTMSRDELHKQEQSLRSCTGKATLNGIDSVRKVLDALKRQGDHSTAEGYHGTLIENFSCDKEFYTCVEVTAGSRLFFHIVDDDKTSTKILREMNRMKLPGEVSFMPLNRLEVSKTHYPDSNNVLPLIRKLRFENKYQRAFEHVFGKTLLCHDIDTANLYSSSENLDCITLEGDQVSRRGALTGGYYDSGKSRLDLHADKLKLTAQIEQQMDDCTNHKQRLENVEKKVDELINEMQRMETKNNKNKDIYERMKRDLRSAKEEHDRLLASRPQQERSLSGLKSSLQTMLTSQASLQTEMEQDLNSTLSAEDQQELNELISQIKELTEENKKALRERSQLEAIKNQIENKLNKNLRKKEERLKRELDDISGEDHTHTLETIEEDLVSVEQRTSENDQRSRACEKLLGDMNKQQKKLQKELEAQKVEENKHQDELTEDAKELEKISTKTASLVKKKNEAMKKLSELGSLPLEAFEKYKDTSMRQLFTKLESCKAELKRYSHVNKKALDHFLSFSEQKEKLISRNEELVEAHQKIIELMQALDHRKYEVIHLTFKQVSKYFTTIFSKLVPQGHGVLVMKTDGPVYTDSSENTEESQGMNGDGELPLVQQFSGVGIKVSFTGNQAEMRDMQQLSGGQKSLVALALIFSIQKCDPAPFYLFDEIDQALDAQHRKGVADMIYELAGDAQFITTTFRPELLQHADKFYGVKFRNKVSHIDCVSREEAYDFVEDDTQHA